MAIVAIPSTASTTRDTYDVSKNYYQVKIQKGVPVIDAEINEMQDNIREFYREWIDKGFGNIFIDTGYLVAQSTITSVNNFSITSGEAYVDGVKAYLGASLDYASQAWVSTATLSSQAYITQLLWNDAGSVPALTTPGTLGRNDLVVLSLIPREITATLDTNIKDPYLGVETARRMQYISGVTVLEGFGSYPYAANYLNSFNYTNSLCKRIPIAWIVRPASISIVTTGQIIDIRSNSVFAAKSDFTNTFIGHKSFYSNTTGRYNVAIGYKTFYSNTTGINNTVVGHAALYSNTTGINNTAIGSGSLYSNTTGVYNTAIGYAALYLNTVGYQNTAIGNESLYSNTTGNRNVAIGDGALYSNTMAYGNTAVGSHSLYLTYTDTSVLNTAVGFYALYGNGGGYSNVAVGGNSLYSNGAGYHCTAVGTSALFNCGAAYNTALGSGAGNNIVSGINNTCIGAGSQASMAVVNNEITLGNGSISSLRCNVTTITALSDEKDKTDIEDIDLGLDFIKALRPRKFRWDKREWYAEKNEDNITIRNEDGSFKNIVNKDGSKKELEWSTGFISQEVEKLQEIFDIKQLRMLSGTEYVKELAAGQVLMPLIKAVQELAKRVEILEGA